MPESHPGIEGRRHREPAVGALIVPGDHGYAPPELLLGVGVDARYQPVERERVPSPITSMRSGGPTTP